MSFPYINWYQDDEHVYIYILNHMCNPKASVENNFLQYNDSKYHFNVELFSSFTLKTEQIERHNYLIILNKTEDLCTWDSLLKERNKYKYFISLNWDKYNSYLKLKNEEEDNNLLENSLYDENEFQHLLKTGALDDISSDEDD